MWQDIAEYKTGIDFSTSCLRKTPVVKVNQQDQGLIDNKFLKISLTGLLGWKEKTKLKRCLVLCKASEER